MRLPAPARSVLTGLGGENRPPRTLMLGGMPAVFGTPLAAYAASAAWVIASIAVSDRSRRPCGLLPPRIPSSYSNRRPEFIVRFDPKRQVS